MKIFSGIFLILLDFATFSVILIKIQSFFNANEEIFCYNRKQQRNAARKIANCGIMVL